MALHRPPCRCVPVPIPRALSSPAVASPIDRQHRRAPPPVLAHASADRTDSADERGSAPNAGDTSARCRRGRPGLGNGDRVSCRWRLSRACDAARLRCHHGAGRLRPGTRRQHGSLHCRLLRCSSRSAPPRAGPRLAPTGKRSDRAAHAHRNQRMGSSGRTCGTIARGDAGRGCQWFTRLAYPRRHVGSRNHSGAAPVAALWAARSAASVGDVF